MINKVKFSSEYTDQHDGDKIVEDVVVERVDLLDDLGGEFVFIETTHNESGRHINQHVSLPLKSIKSLIKALQKVSK